MKAIFDGFVNNCCSSFSNALKPPTRNPSFSDGHVGLSVCDFLLLSKPHHSNILCFNLTCR